MATWGPKDHLLNKEKIMSKNKVIEEEYIFSDEDYKLVVTIVKRGYEGDVLESAKMAGHTGSTVLNAKGVSKIEKRFLGFSIDPENSVILMVVKDELVLPVVKSIYASADFRSEAKGMVFALPISLVSGVDEPFDDIDLN